MKAFYNFTQKIKDAVSAEPFVKTITFGSIYDVDLSKMALYPLTHVLVEAATISDNTITFNASIICMDLVDESKDDTTDVYRGNDNEQDVLNTQLALGTRIVAKLQRGTLFQDGFHIVGDADCEPFTDRFEQAVAGWVVNIVVEVKNDMTSC